MSYLALYRKYRPQSFEDIVGQQHVVKTLQNAIKSNKVAHAYLFCGPRGVGKTTIARLLAKAINCSDLKTENKTESCDKCNFCKEINKGRAVDIIEIDAASNRGIDEIRELKEKIKFTPNVLKYKVFIIDEVHMLTIEAFNALLKTLEEPPSHAIFVLATTEAHKIPATILSRCQRFDFKKLTQAEISKQLLKIAKKENVKIDEKSLNLLASNASGSSRDGLSLLNQVLSLEDDNIAYEDTKAILGISDLSQAIDFLDFLIKKDAHGAVKLINDLTDSGYDLKQFYKNLIDYFRKLLISKINNDLLSGEVSFTGEQLEKLKEQSEKLTSKEIIFFIGSFIRAKKEIDDNVIPQLPLEIATIEVIKPKEDNINKVRFEEGAVDNNKKTLPNNKQAAPTNKEERLLPKEPEKEISKPKEISTNNKVDNSVVDYDENEKEEESTTTKLDLETIKNLNINWANFIKEVSSKNFTLGSFLNACNPIEIQNNKVVLACKYSFHKEKLRDLKNKKIIEDVAEKLFKVRMLFDLTLVEDLSEEQKSKMGNKQKKKDNSNKINSSDSPDLAKQALDVFGGNTI